MQSDQLKIITEYEDRIFRAFAGGIVIGAVGVIIIGLVILGLC